MRNPTPLALVAALAAVAVGALTPGCTPKHVPPTVQPAPRPAPAPAPSNTGTASWYGAAFTGKPTASGEPFSPDKLTAAHRTYPFGTKVQVTRIDTGQSVTVVINDRGPYSGGRLIDLSEAAARQLGMIDAGTARVRLAVVGCVASYGGCRP